MVLVEVFEDSAFEEPPQMVLRGYVFLFWAELLPNIPDHDAVSLQEWIDKDDVYSIIDRQVTSYQNSEYLLRNCAKAGASQPDKDDTEHFDDIVF